MNVTATRVATEKPLWVFRAMAEEGTRGERIVAEIRREDITSEKLINIFDEWSVNYDQVSEELKSEDKG